MRWLWFSLFVGEVYIEGLIKSIVFDGRVYEDSEKYSKIIGYSLCEIVCGGVG
jgi:hypothetical protein